MEHDSTADADDPDAVDLDDPSLYLSRELSELAFQRRVLYEAEDDRNPLLERIRFIAIVTRNLDEFAMKRIGGLKQQIEAGVTERTPDGRTPTEQWEEVHETLHPLLERQATCYQAELQPALAAAGIQILEYEELDGDQRETIQTYFEESVLPTLTPLSFDPAHPFPFISNRSLSLAALIRRPDADEPTFTRIKIPPNRPRLVQIADTDCYVRLEEIIRANLDLLLPNVEIIDTALFRLTRNAEVRRDEEVAEDLTDAVEEVLEQRRFATVVRLEIAADVDARIRSTLKEQLALTEREIYDLPGPLDYRVFAEIADLDRPALQLDPWTPQPHPRLRCRSPSGSGDEDVTTPESDVFDRIREGDILLHHPYHDFTETVQEFLSTAATDPDVLAVKAAIYRTASDSQVIQSLIDAADNGKQVAVMVELKARFDEKNNLEWVRRLEEEGIHVAYGTVGLKTHTKTALVVREEGDDVELYSHVGTGNYHSETAQGYVDLGLLTADQEIGRDLVDVFNFFTGPSLNETFRKLLIAPVTMRRRFTQLIRREADHARAGRPARIVAKVNGLEDPAIVRELYRASMAGVEIDLIVRDICRLRPGLDGVSETIRVHSIVGRFLEHARIFYFQNGAQGDGIETGATADGDGTPQYYIGSADWMTRNLDNRVEAVTPVTDPEIQRQLRFVLELNLADNRKRWEMNADGTYQQCRPADDEPTINTQERLMEVTRNAATCPEPVAGIPAEASIDTGHVLTWDEGDVDATSHTPDNRRDNTDEDQQTATDGCGTSISPLDVYSDRWYVPDSDIYQYAVWTPEGGRRYLKTERGAIDLLSRLYDQAEQ